MARIELDHLHKTYGPVIAVKDLSIVIEDGEFVVFVGPSGCGKTTTLRMIAGFEDPTSGTIELAGAHVHLCAPGVGYAAEYVFGWKRGQQFLAAVDVCPRAERI